MNNRKTDTRTHQKNWKKQKMKKKIKTTKEKCCGEKWKESKEEMPTKKISLPFGECLKKNDRVSQYIGGVHFVETLMWLPCCKEN